MKKIVFAAALSAGLLAFGNIGEFAKKVAFSIEYEGAGELSGIPVLVKLAANSPVGFSYSDCAADGSDIRFTDANGEAIPFEIDTWNTEGESLVWVKPTSLAKGTTFTMHYSGTPAAANDPTAVWTEYTGVWHFNELGTDTADNSKGLFPNSTSVEGIDGHLSVVSHEGEPGKFGSSFRPNDATDYNKGNFNDGGVWVVDSGEESPLDATNGMLTVSVWIKHQNWTKYNNDKIFYKRLNSDNTGDPNNAFLLESASTANDNGRLLARTSSNGRSRDESYDGPDSRKDWLHVTVAYGKDRTRCTLYENGNLIKDNMLTQLVNNDAPLVFGNTITIPESATGAGSYAWNGWIDEARYLRDAKSAEWIATEYAAMASESFLSAGTVVSAAPVLGEVVVNSEATKATISGMIVSVGTGATAVDVYLAIGPSAEELGEAKKIASGVTDAFSHEISGLTSQATYCYELTVVNNATPAQSASLRGSFTTEPCFDFRRKVTFEIGYEGEGVESHSGIPVLVKLSRNSPVGFRYSDCATDGSDIRFTDADGKQIPFEIDTWDPQGESIIWVKPASIAKGTTFTMYYKGKADLVPNPKDVWTGYAGVWHLGTLGADTTAYSQGLYPNSTAAEGIDAHLSADSIPGEVGRFGKAFRPNDSTALKQGNYQKGGAWVVDAGDDSPLDVGDVLTISGWIKHQDWPNAGDEHIFYKRRDSDNVNEPTGAFVVEAQGAPDFKIAGKGSGSNRVRDDGPTAPHPKDNWIYVTLVFDGQTHTLYKNGGEFSKTGTYLSRVVDNNAPLVFGNTVTIADGEAGSNAWNGWIDEVRYLKGAKSAAWVAAEYASMADETFVTAGEVEKINPPGLMILVR